MVAAASIFSEKVPVLLGSLSGNQWTELQVEGRFPFARKIRNSRPKTAESRPGTAGSRPKTGDRMRELRRSKSLGASEKTPPIPRQDSGKSSASKSSNEKEQVNEKAPSSPNRQPSIGKLRRRSDRIATVNNENVERTEDVIDMAQEDTPIPSGATLDSTLKPVLLPPLTNPRRTRSFRRNGSKDSDTSTTASPSTFLRSVPLPVQLYDTPMPTSSPNAAIDSDFVFPFRSDQPAEVTEDHGTSQWQRNSTSTDDDLEPHPSWPLQLEDLLEPEPPFAAEDRHYISPTPSESRLSTITEEGTVRESTVATPPNIVVTDRPHSRSTIESTTSIRTITPMSPSLATWFSQGGAQYPVNSAVN